MYIFSIIGTVLFLALIVPLVIILGERARGGPVTVASIGAALGFAIFWLITANTLPQNLTANLFASLIGYIGGVLLTLTAWALALADTRRTRRWGWLAAVWLAFYANIAATYFILTSDVASCAYASDLPYCPSQSRILLWLVVAGCFVGPGVMLAYALRHATRAKPDGLSVSPLDDADTVPAQTGGAH